MTRWYDRMMIDKFMLLCAERRAGRPPEKTRTNLVALVLSGCGRVPNTWRCSARNKESTWTTRNLQTTSKKSFSDSLMQNFHNKEQRWSVQHRSNDDSWELRSNSNCSQHQHWSWWSGTFWCAFRRLQKEQGYEHYLQCLPLVHSPAEQFN